MTKKNILERLADDEVDTLLHLDRELLVERPAHAVVGGGASVLVHPRQRKISGDETLVAGDVARDAHGRAVEILELVLEADRRELVAAGVEGQGLEDVGARLAELDVHLPQRFRVRQRHLRRERAGSNPAALLQLQEVSAVAEHGTLGEAFEDVLLSQAASPSKKVESHGSRVKG